MLRLSFLLGLVGLCVAAKRILPFSPETQPSTIYSVYIPEKIRPGFDVVATVAVPNTPNPIQVTANFTSADRQIAFSTQENITDWSRARMTLGEMPINYRGSKKFNFTVKGIDIITREVLFKNSTTNFVFDAKSFSILIQTDKPIYQPGQTINFRAICMNPNLRPLTGVVTYKVQDPNRNVVFLKNDVILNKGVAGGKFNLSRHAIEGEYVITFSHNGVEEKISITVQAYKLPKYEVKVNAPVVVYPDTEQFVVSISARYTFGQEVYGSAMLRMERKRSFGSSLRPPRILTKTFRRFEGKMNVVITKQEMRENFGLDFFDDKLEIIAFVTETLTSTTFNATTETDLKQEKVKVEVLSRSQVAKPGLIYQALVRVTEQDGNLLMESERRQQRLVVTITYNYQRYHAQLSRPIVMNFDIPPNGLIPLAISLRRDNFTSVYFRINTNITSFRSRIHFSVPRALSPSDSFIQVIPFGEAAEGDVTTGRRVGVFLTTTETVRKLRVMILSRGVILQDRMIMRSTEELRSVYNFTVTSEMTPSVLIIASYLRWNNTEMVADSLWLNVRPELQNEMTISSSDDEVDAGTNLRINVTTTSTQSYVGISAIDRSVLLLKTGNDITRDRVVAELEEYTGIRKMFPSPIIPYFHSSGARVAEEIFQEAAVNVLTNTWIYKIPQVQYGGCGGGFERETFANLAGEEFADGFRAENAQPPRASRKSQAAAPRTRTLFPETWLWTSADTRNERSVLLNVTAPDTITSWQISAFSMSSSHGLGIASPYQLTVFRKFFISLNLPLKITRGEIIIVQAIVFNYYEQDLTVNLRLNLNNLPNGVELLRPGNNNLLGAGPLRRIVVPAGEAVSVKYPLRINILGQIPIRVTATSSRDVDSVIRYVFAKPEGIPQCYSTSQFISKSLRDRMPTIEQLSLRVPEGVINGSVRATIHTYGDILGSTMTNLGNLLKTPSGCGEQNMINFAPDVFVTLHLQRIGRLDEETRRVAFQHIIDGYMNQLRYKRIDGSFSAFGERDASGSTWLTAFVVKCFNFAKQLQPELIEQEVINQAVSFLVSQQIRDGSFKEPGRVIHQDMQGGVNSPITMTAYVLITMTETEGMKRSSRLRSVIRRAVTYLESRVDQLQTPYELALVSYALALAESGRAQTAFERLTSIVETTEEFRFSAQSSGASIYSPRWAPPYVQPAPYKIETNAYLLLIYALIRDFSSALPKLRWFVSKQNEFGGYSSTQDTVMAVQALWRIAGIIPDQPQNLALTITHSDDNEFNYQVTINERNEFVYNTSEITPINGTVEVSALGSGIGVAQLSVCYNIPTTPYEEEPFLCKMNVTSKNNDTAMLEYCCALREDNMEPTGMFLFEIGLLNGFTIDVIEEERRNPMAKLIDLESDRVNVYYNQLLPREELCTKLRLIRIAEVAAIKPATVKAYEYYRPGKIVIRQYNVSGLNETGVCDVCGYECVGCPAPILSEWKPWTPCVTFCKPENSTRVQECFDPSLKKRIDFFRCGIDEIPTETRMCHKPFSCPDISDGLWYDVPRSHRSYENRVCRVFGNQRSPWTVIPGTMLDGHRQYLRCSINVLNIQEISRISSLLQSAFRARGLSMQVLQNVLNNSYGFTISFLVKPHFYREVEPVTFISIGEIGELPILVLEKPIQQDTIRLAVSIDMKRDFVDNISLSAIPVGNWSHVMIIWNERTGAKVMVNGEEVGRPSTVVVEASRRITRNLQFNLGRKAIGDDMHQGYFPGSFSALHFWSSVLPEQEAFELSEYYKEILTYHGFEPLLSVRHLRELVPQHQRQCFTEPKFLSRIYAEQKCG